MQKSLIPNTLCQTDVILGHKSLLNENFKAKAFFFSHLCNKSFYNKTY
jgi:hypothetical protein